MRDLMKDLVTHIYFLVLNKPHYLTIVFAVCLISVSFIPQVVHAADDLASMGSNIEDQSKGLAGAAQILFYLFGFIFVGVGLIMLATSREKGKAMACLIIGFALTSIGFIITTGSSSLFGEDKSQTDKLFN